ncbi:glycosyltransferase, partial [Proteus mirabilis]|nr:glycosyltransferase [Proteus mirabilis]
MIQLFCLPLFSFSIYLISIFTPYYIKIIKNEKNRGVSYSRNVGIYNSIGKFILFLDSDDQYK